MSETRPPPPDQGARDVIAGALDENLLVEAGAGSGKTTALVGRILRVVRSGRARMSQIAAVTFTRKAAGELRERLQEEIERSLRAGTDGTSARVPGDEAERLSAALIELDLAFVGTIHAFCARLLRERPLAAGVDPDFGELTTLEERAEARAFWDAWVERQATERSGLLVDIERAGLTSRQLEPLFRSLTEASDVELPTEQVELRPDAIAAVRTELDAILDLAASGLHPQLPRRAGSMQKKVRRALHLRRVRGFENDQTLLECAAEFCSGASQSRTYKWWADEGIAREVEQRLNDLFAWDGAAGATPPPGRALVHTWWAVRYRPAIAFARGAADAFAEERRRTGRLSFHDLLVLAARLLRTDPAARTALGARWTHLLVDEFQDTDPIQAELVFLLASDPSADEAGEGPAWHRCTPRPGALFVVGDPKQSIYRFRRADIALYEQVRARFEEIGRVVELTANFRSVPEIGALVEGVFGEGGRFPSIASDVQAAFAPLRTRRPATPGSGVFTYALPKVSRSVAPVVDLEAGLLATWIADRVAAGERGAGDFLVLTPYRRHLAPYASALEARGIPVVVSGAGVGAEYELGELRVVLEAMADPADPVKTVAALEGLLLGIDPGALLRHRSSGGRFDLRYPGREGDVETREALETLHGWWEHSTRAPADEVVERIVSETHLLPLAVSGELGSVRGGALVYALELLRVTSGSVGASLGVALEVLSALLDDEDAEAEAPLEPQRGGAVRLMNVHKAKGLEAPVVVLAHPSRPRPRAPEWIVERREDGSSGGRLLVSTRHRYSSTIHAAPLEWNAAAQVETAMLEAESDRLLYVAATRARDELVFGLPKGWKGTESWGGLYSWASEHAATLELTATPPPPRPLLEAPLEEVHAEVHEVAHRRAQAGEARLRFETVTGRAKREFEAAVPADDDGPAQEDATLPAGSARQVDVEGIAAWHHEIEGSSGTGGMAWGSAVHTVLEAAASGTTGARLREIARAALVENDRPMRGGEPTELEGLLRLVEAVRSSELWTRAEAAEVVLTEHPFAWTAPDGTVLEGVIDLLFREPDGWVVVDYKTDRDDVGFSLRLESYERQVALYREAWEALSGETVKEAKVWRV